MSTRRPARKSASSSQLMPMPEPISVGDKQPPAAVEPAPARPTSLGRPRAGSEDEPRYRQMVRTEARLRPDQAADLTALRRRILNNRQVRDERITDNTLLRIAIDLLLAHSDRLTGDTEDQLRASVMPEHFESQDQ